jgi:hypothetical protein
MPPGMHLTILFFQKILQLLEGLNSETGRKMMCARCSLLSRESLRYNWDCSLPNPGLLPDIAGTSFEKNLYGRLDVCAQFSLMDKVSNLRLKDHSDCNRYLSKFSLARAQFSKMGVDYTELQAVHTLIKGLPIHGSWISFTQL